MQVINSQANEIVVKYKKLKDKKYRALSNKYLIEGLRFVTDAVNLNQNLDAIFVDIDKADKYKDLLDKVNCKIYYLEQKVLKALSDTVNNQGIIAVVNIKQNNGFAAKNNCLVLDNISDPGNLGTIIRTAAAFSYFDIFLINCVDAFNPKVLRSTMGGIFFVNLFEYSIAKAVEVLKDNNYKIFAADMAGEDFEKIDECGKLAIAIKMGSTVESLNAAVSAAILMNRFKNF